MPQYVLMRINNAECAWICLNILDKHNSEHARILNVSDAVKSHCVNYRAVIEAEVYLEQCQIFKMELFAKRILLECGGIYINIPKYH